MDWYWDKFTPLAFLICLLHRVQREFTVIWLFHGIMFVLKKNRLSRVIRRLITTKRNAHRSVNVHLPESKTQESRSHPQCL